MKTIAVLASITALTNAHAIWQQLWRNGEDLESTCARMPQSNSPIQDYTSTALQCNVNPSPAPGTCGFAAGDTVTIEMHQHNSRACTEEGIGGYHWGPVLAYMSKVEDAAAADGSSEFFKVYENTWKKAEGGGTGQFDYWGTKDLDYNCGKLDFTIPDDLAPGDYLLRAEAIALHSANAQGGAQHYVTCYQLTVTGDGTATPTGVKFPEAYSATGPGLGFRIYDTMTEYPAPGPALYARGTKAEPQLQTFGTIAYAPKPNDGASAPVSGDAVAPSSKAYVAPSSAATSAASTSASAKTSAASSTAASAAAPPAASPTTPTTKPETGDKTYNVDSLAAYLETQPGSDVEFTMEEFIAWLEKVASGSDTAEPTAAEPPAAGKPTTSATSAQAYAPSAARPSSTKPAAAPSTLATSPRPAPTSGSDSGAEVQGYGRCGGQGYSGSTTCASGFTCKVQNSYYSQCVKSEGGNAAPPSAPKPTPASSTKDSGSYPTAPTSAKDASVPSKAAAYPANPVPSKADAYPANPVVSKEAANSPTPSASAMPPADKLWTVDELIAFLEKAAE